MQQAERLNMARWQSTASGGYANSIEELHACENSACFAGYIALSPLFQAIGGTVIEFGMPKIVIDDGDCFALIGDSAVRHFLGIEDDDAINTNIINDMVVNINEDNALERYVDCEWREWKPVHVIRILQGMMYEDPKLFELYKVH